MFWKVLRRELAEVWPGPTASLDLSARVQKSRRIALFKSPNLNKRLIYYYFASKDDLFLAVLWGTYADIRKTEQQLHLLDLQPAQAVRCPACRRLAQEWY